ncbi:MAG: helicase C-terminal domain-containing protein [Chloroflexota bacterium]
MTPDSVDRTSLRPSLPLDVPWLVSLLSPGGLMEMVLPSFEYRPSQVEMLEAVAYAFNGSEKLIVEAGTGTGKSIAYLIPAIYFSFAAKTPVVISTNTINLQEQLIGKDIPDLARTLPLPEGFRAVTLKGRGNYICLRKWQLYRHTLPGMDGGLELVPRISGWLSTTETGDGSELGVRGRQSVLWGRICAQEGECLGERCQFHQQGRCFLYRARSRAKGANIVVVNHALLLADAVSGNQLLPHFDHIVIDEAHHLEDAATQQFGWRVSERGVADLAGEVEQEMGALQRALKSGRPSPQRRQDLSGLIEDCLQRCSEVVSCSSAFFSAVAVMVDRFAARGDAYERSLRLCSEGRTGDAWRDVELGWENFSLALSSLEMMLGRVHNGLEGLPGGEEMDDIRLGLISAVDHSRQMRERLSSAVTSPEEDMVYWASSPSVVLSVRPYERSRRYKEMPEASLHAAPLDVSGLLGESLFSGKETMVLTSATLSSGGGFDFINQRLGFVPDNKVKLASPFDYMSVALVCMLDDIPPPDAHGYQGTVEQALTMLAPVVEGRLLALFTSHQSLKKTYTAIRGTLEKLGITTFGQGVDGAPEQVLAGFRMNPKAVLLGTASLWEGIDVVGDMLSVLVIVRLPFGVPVDPVMAARAEQYEHPFAEYSVPLAVLRFKQGFGRLIRSKSDRGVVVVLDRRMHQKAYGSAFLTALPPCNMRRCRLSDLPGIVGEWLVRG